MDRLETIFFQRPGRIRLEVRGVRLKQARAELAFARNLWQDAIARANETIDDASHIGRVKYQVAALQTRDTPVLLGLFLVISLGVVLANIVTDLAYAAVDPRIRLR